MMRLALVLLSLFPALTAQDPRDRAPSPYANLAWRSIGPFNMSGRVTDVEGVPGDPSVLWVGAASGGVWKTTNGGVTFEPVFDGQPVQSIGDIGLAPSNPDVVWVGTGEGNPRNSVSFGNGVYRSTDGGGHFDHLGLEDTRHITKVLVHPTDPDTAWVAALGHIFGPNENRGVFVTTDGGKSWTKTLYLDERHGCSDLAIVPGNPKVLFAGMWLFERKPWTHTTGSENGGVFKSIDAGLTWKKIDKGFPKLIGRIGIEVSPSDPNVVYAITESHEGTVFRSDDQGETFRKVSDDVQVVSRGLYYTHIRVDPTDSDRVYAVSSRLFVSIDGGKSFERISRTTHVDFHALWIDPTNPRLLWQGQDGGIAVSRDRAKTWKPIRNLPLAQFYQVFHDDRAPFYAVGGGLQDNGTWWGPSRTREPSGIMPDDWKMFSFGDAYWVVPHPDDPDLLISESQAGGIMRTDIRTRQQLDVSPQPRRNDGGPAGDLEYRFNWNAPIVKSPHAKERVYFCGNVVFQSDDFGDNWRAISPDLTTNDPDKIGDAGGPAFVENTTAEYHCSIISFAESAAKAGLLWVGTDDGRLWRSDDGGADWTELSVPGVPEFSPVSHVEPAHDAADTAWVAFDRHMFDDLRPHIYRTDDAGDTWQRVCDGIADDAFVQVVRQDPRNADLLWAGTELGLFASRNRGGKWRRLHLSNLPAVSVHDILVHPRDNDLILGTHGRGIWIFDDATPLQQLGFTVERSALHVFKPRPAVRFPARMFRYGLGDEIAVAPNPPAGSEITYWLRDEIEPSDEPNAEPPVVIEILDASGQLVRMLKRAPAKRGLNRAAWNLAMDGPEPRREEEAGDFRDPPRGPMVMPGTYTVRVSAAGETRETTVEVVVDPELEVSAEALGRQHEVALALADMQGVIHATLRGLDSLESQREARRATLKGIGRPIPAALETAWKSHEELAAELEKALAREDGKPFWSQGPRLSERLGSLFSNVDSQFSAPTPAQIEFFGELEAETKSAVSRINRFLTIDVPAFNGKLEEHGIPKLLVPEPVGR